LLAKNFNNDVYEFYGYTENKETQLSLDFGAFVEKIYVVPGQLVKKGEVLMKLNKSSFVKDINTIDKSIEEINEKKQLNELEIHTAIEKIKSESNKKIAQIQTEIRVEESKWQYEKDRINPAIKNDQNTIRHPSLDKIEQLKKELKAEEVHTQSLKEAYLSQLKKLKSTNAEVAKLILNKNFLLNEMGKLKIVAPLDGLIGNINCKPQEYVSSQNTLISFYEQCPNAAVGYVHETLSLKVNVGDSLIITSTLRPNQKVKGKVTGKGHRIVEIPERMRKIPDYKTYGMEVYVSIEDKNNFLQKEMVKISTLLK
jgi:multidrug resistance efflux pump